ncbi:MAG: response regulator [Victivallales bacterium]|jgi:CheY-like chemotaxis protein|nr:response regulator [Victivallales bacterium]MBT7299881.1 response regulator [Victivallales bacterium]
MRDTDFRFEDPLLSEEERLGSLLALNRGMFSAWEAVSRRLDGYTALVEEELEGNPAGLAYLSRLRSLVQCTVGWPAEAAGLFGRQGEFESISLRPLLEGAVDRCAKLLSPKLSLRLLPTEGEIAVTGVFFELQQVLVRALLRYSHACSGDCSEIVLSAREVMLDERAVAVLDGFEKPGLIVQISFTTGGEAAPATVFEPFWDVVLSDDAHAPADLRLLQIYGTILQHGGDLRFLRKADGVQESILLPATVRRKDMQVVSDVDDQALHGSETILLVDDEDMIWDVIIDMLQELGYAVLLAGNGLEAVEIYGENPGSVDLVLLDMVMPELDGHQAFLRLREIDPGVRVLLSSGYVSEEDVAGVLQGGAAGFLRKPYRMTDLARKVRAILDA